MSGKIVQKSWCFLTPEKETIPELQWLDNRNEIKFMENLHLPLIRHMLDSIAAPRCMVISYIYIFLHP